MFKIGSISGYSLNPLNFKNGISDLKTSTKHIVSNYKLFLFLSVVFILLNIIKTTLFANAPSMNYHATNSVVLSGSANYTDYITFFSFIFSFLSLFFIPICAIRKIQYPEEKFKSICSFTLSKILDYRIYLMSFFVLLVLLLCIKIVSIPIMMSIPTITIALVKSFSFDLQVILSANHGMDVETVVRQIIDLVSSNPEYTVIADGLKNISIPLLQFAFITSSLVFIYSVLITIFVVLNLILYPYISFVEAIKGSFFINGKNALYLTAITLGLVLFGIISFIFSPTGIFYAISNGIIFLYSIYIFSFAASRSIINLSQE